MRRNVSIGMTRLGTSLALLGALLVVPAPARAQDDVTLSMARERFKEGVNYFDKKEFSKARVAFLQAYALKKHPAVLLNLAQSELRSGHEADAAQHFAQYLREHKDATDAERQGAETGLTAAKALVGELALDVDVAGAEVYVDGDLEGVTPLPGSIFLAPGSHAVEARKDGKAVSANVTASAGQTGSASLSLSTPKPTGAVEPVVGAPTEAGEAPPEASHSGRKAFFPWLFNSPPGLIGAGLTGVGLIGGVAFALGSKSSYNAADGVERDIENNAIAVDKKDNGPKGVCVNVDGWLKDHAADQYSDAALRAKRVGEYTKFCNKYKDNVKSGDTFKKLAIVSFAVGGAAAVGTIVYYFVDSGKEESASKGSRRRMIFIPLYEPGFAGGMVSGSF
jgi:hypothetical protein